MIITDADTAALQHSRYQDGEEAPARFLNQSPVTVGGHSDYDSERRCRASCGRNWDRSNGENLYFKMMKSYDEGFEFYCEDAPQSSILSPDYDHRPHPGDPWNCSDIYVCLISSQYTDSLI